ncbi:hypothetical protein CAPTEDRAFT_212332 [Capitella teleta]|uniref:Uncharacterized protein n=1 Tax=Capitella teleta TaxID=283909 RepID=R7TLU9_CAPTE|nr:hypothetical protein CAPTEDRAFT_212332 [Capitella teleta]|eukprot:ELT92080.1 hypothetical protein CAPTEDRAFT_212332 [Capitella teleta]
MGISCTCTLWFIRLFFHPSMHYKSTLWSLWAPGAMRCENSAAFLDDPLTDELEFMRIEGFMFVECVPDSLLSVQLTPPVPMATTNSLDIATDASASKRPSMECYTSVMRNTVKGLAIRDQNISRIVLL